MSNSFFRFKQFIVQQDRCAMKVGTDGVLLGAWTEVKDAKRIVDVGTGTGLIALMLAQRSQAAITALEIDERAASQAAENVANSPFKTQIQVIPTSFQDFIFADTSKYDLIVSNPPFFHNSLKGPAEDRKQARHTDSLLPEELIEGCLRLLSPNGSFCVIFPPQEAMLFIEKARMRGFFCTRKTQVIPRLGVNTKRLLLQFELEEKWCKEDFLILETDTRHQYTEAFKQLTADFYL